jgi:hypothetical protein
MFSLELLQAINDWQRGGDRSQKERRGRTLKSLTSTLPPEFRQSRFSYRQISLYKGSLWKLADELHLPETISSWTESLEVARTFKGGVPPPGSQGIIFLLFPSHNSVIINLNRLYHDDRFLSAIESHSREIKGFHDGIGRYQNSQEEVVIEVSNIRLNDVHELGGYSSSESEIRQQYMNLHYGPHPSNAEFKAFERRFALANISLGPCWIDGKAKDKVLSNIAKQMPSLRAIKKLQEAVIDNSTFMTP